MSFIYLYRCPVFGCKHHTNPVQADSSQIKNHLKHDHDYKELQQTAFSCKLIDSIYEKRGLNWFVESLIEFTKMNGVNCEK